MHCPKCDAKSKIIDSRMRLDVNRKDRRRKCDDCGHRFSTVEILVSEEVSVKERDNLRKERDNLRKQRAAILQLSKFLGEA